MRSINLDIDFDKLPDYIVDLELTNVRYQLSKKKLILRFRADKVLEDSELDFIKRVLSEKLDFINLEICMDYQKLKNSEKLINELIPLIKNEIAKNLQSSSSWIEQLSIEALEDKINIYPPSKSALYMISRNGLIDKIGKEIRDKYNLRVALFVSEARIEDEGEEFLKIKMEEEAEIANQALKELPKIKKDSGPIIKSDYRYGKLIKQDIRPVKEINLHVGFTAVQGYIFNIEAKDIRNNKTIVNFYLTDLEDSIEVKSFMKKEDAEEFLVNVTEDTYVKLSGSVDYDDFSKGIVITMNSLEVLEAEKRQDNCGETRVELHLHTKMSSMDGLVELDKLIEQAESWGHKALAITDHGVVQAFPQAMNLEKKSDVKIIYGMEGYLINDEKDILNNYKPGKSSFVIFDIETTGLSAKNDMITEIGALKVKDGQIIDKFSSLVNPKRPISDFITKLTGITNEMVADKPTIDLVIRDFNEFIKDSILVAHNATFDMGFIRENMNKLSMKLDSPVIDTLELARAVFPRLKNHKLNTLAKHLSVSLENHHRAVDDAKATTEIFLKILELVDIESIKDIAQINKLTETSDSVKDKPYHIVVLAKNLIGLKNLYRLVSKSHMDYFYRQPRIPKSFLKENREGLLIGSACSQGELYQAIINNKSQDEINSVVKFYDYLEIQPLDNNRYLIDNGIIKDEEQLKDINKRILYLGDKFSKLVVATGDVHFLNPEDEIYRRILLAGQGFRDADKQAPLYFKTTDEMLNEFSYLGPRSKEVVVINTNKINDMIEDIKPIPDGTFPPVIEGSDQELRDITYKRAYELYGNPLPDLVEKRLERELGSIIKNGYAVMYIISQKLVWQSLEDGYLVGSRGSVGSSFVATMSGITEINPLSPHYLCPSCKYSNFFTNGEIASGADLEDKDCPNCGTRLIKDGHDIPFEVFLGFDGDKEPDIDLNFAGEYQSVAHKNTEKLFGKDYVFRAGTIGTIAEKTAYGFVKKYFEAEGDTVNKAEINRLVKGCTGVKRTSGQHPGGVMIVPHYKEILDFSPIQYPANDSSSGVITTHFDYNAISSNILKLDILGHDVPTIIKMLEDMTGVVSTDIALDEKKTMSLFSSTKSLGVRPEEIDCKVGTLGIPEFGTRFVRQMLIDTEPSTFSELVRISGLSHGTDVWLNNAQDLVRKKIAPLSKVISTREDIMLSLINVGMDKSKAFTIMEKVRKGRGLSEDEEAEMRSLGVEEWYIDSCKKIKYMFPKAHAAAYVMMSFRIAYYKVYYPEAFYATYFTTKAADFDADIVIKGKEYIEDNIRMIEEKGREATAKEKNLLIVLEVAMEMYARGYSIRPVDLYKSHSDIFQVKNGQIIPPLKCLEGVGENVARKIALERDEGEFLSKEDLISRAGVSKPAIEVLSNHGCLDGLPDSNQLDLFSL